MKAMDNFEAKDVPNTRSTEVVCINWLDGKIISITGTQSRVDFIKKLLEA